jgi:hypothetical protein
MAAPKFVQGESVLQFSKGLRYPLSKPIERRQALDRDAGGGLQVEDLGVTIRRRTLSFTNLPLADYTASINWYENVAQGALNQFTYHDENGDTMQVLWTSSVYDFQETAYQKFSGTIEIEVVG